MMINAKLKNGIKLPPRLSEWCSRLCFIAGPLISYHLVEILNYNDPWHSFSTLQIGLNLIWYYLVAFILWLVLGRHSLSAGVTACLFALIGIMNRYAIRFRGRTLFPGDLSTLRTALNVVWGYNYTPDRTQITCLVVLGVFLALLFLLPRKKGRRLPPGRVWIPLLATSLCYILVFFHTGFLARFNIEPSMWTTRGNGFVLNYTVCLRYSRVECPEEYDPEALNEFASGFPSDTTGAKPTPIASNKRPVNIIVVMNEAFSDLSYIEGLETNEDFLPFCHSLTENTVKGTAYSSVFGGTTANSEYEFLTGNTTAFLPAGTVPYQLYVKPGAPSLVAQMNAMGYETVAMHPYYASGWNRRAVYSDFGFDRMLFLDDFQDLSYMRTYATDRSDYENVIRLYEEKEEGQPLFVFNVTMQNHSAYNVPWNGLDRSVWLTGKWEGRFGTVSQYLSLIRESDSALQYLVEYFSSVEEPTMILLFGDHQPQVATNFYTEALGGDFEELDAETAQGRQGVPFLLWANYDIREESGVRLSLNYLSTLLAERANLPKTGYQRFLSVMRREVPVINSVGYLEAGGTFTSDEEELSDKAREALETYRQLQYNVIFDADNLVEDFFFLRED